MKRLSFLLLLAVAFIPACDRGSNTESQRLAEERAALERDRTALEADKAAAQQASIEQERARLDSERATLALEQAKLAGNRDAMAAAERNAKVAEERAQRLAAEKRAAEEGAARREVEMREREARAAADAAEDDRAAQTVAFFYDALDPHGDWVETDRYGYAFRPSSARDPRWRPYTDGGWVYTEYGWTWRSNESFGWATYHYGRWARVPRLGWIWVPNTEWGPAWVSWRRSDDFIGWAPLPPDAWSSSGFTASVDSYYDIGPGLYAFLPVGDFGEKTYVGKVVVPERNVTIINQTVNVTNVTYQKVQNNVRVVNRGPDITVVNQRSRQPVQRLNVERVKSDSGRPARIRGNTLEMVAPMLRAAPAQAKPKKVNGTMKAAEVERGWAEAGGDSSKFRETTRQEARRAEGARPPQQQPQRAATPPPGVRPPAPPAPRATPSADATPEGNRAATQPFNRPPAAKPSGAQPPQSPASPAIRKPAPQPATTTPAPSEPAPATPRGADRLEKRKRDARTGEPAELVPTAPTPNAAPTRSEQRPRRGPGARQPQQNAPGSPSAIPSAPTSPALPTPPPLPQGTIPAVSPAATPAPPSPPLKGFRGGRKRLGIPATQTEGEAALPTPPAKAKQ